MKRFILFLLFSSAFLANAQFGALGTARGQQCVSNLKQIGAGLMMFESDHGSRPAKLEDAANYGLRGVLACPVTRKNYLYLGPSRSRTMPVAMDALGNHPNEIHVLFGDGHVESIRHSSAHYKGLAGCFKGLSPQEKKNLAEILRKLDSGK